jgi:hypothetical protein
MAGARFNDQLKRRPTLQELDDCFRRSRSQGLPGCNPTLPHLLNHYANAQGPLVQIHANEEHDRLLSIAQMGNSTHNVYRLARPQASQAPFTCSS